MDALLHSFEMLFAGHRLLLLPDRAVYWPAREALIVADVHLGKAMAFRAAGIPAPTGASAKDLGRLSALLGATGAGRLIVLGDWVHGSRSHQPELFELVSRWRGGHGDVEITLVRGNHDKHAGPTPPEWRIREVEEGVDELGIILAHHPRRPPAVGVLCGHLHPGVWLRDFDGSGVSVPGFIFDGDSCGILPGFGSFTGSKCVPSAAGQRRFAVVPNRVIEIT